MREEEEARWRKELEDNKRDNTQTVRKGGNKMVTIKEVKTVEIKSDPLDYNHGDDDLKPYLDKTMANLEKLIDLDKSVLKRALHTGTLLVTGVRCWTALHSENWRHRDAAVVAYLDFLKADLLEKYHGWTKNLFKASIDIAREACQDKLL
jgi:hypothetical protein